ncbi:virion phosphoprotein [Cetacean poxvirus 1]|nr:virion phosphoprotein [Cetacean poxvirus 1]
MIPEQRTSSTIYNSLCKIIILSITKHLNIDLQYLEQKAKQLCYCPSNAKREALINSIYLKCENDVNVESIDHLNLILSNLYKHSVYVCDTKEFWRLYNTLKRFTHCVSFFSVCLPTVHSTLATLITLILSNKLIYTTDMIEHIESYILDSSKPLSNELIDLLEIKYGLINLIQYKILPIILKENNTVAGSLTHNDPISNYTNEVNKLLQMPVKSNIVSNIYSYLSQNCSDICSTPKHFVAGLKIEELRDAINLPSKIKSTLHQETNITPEQEKSIVTTLEKAKQYSKGYVLDGKVTSPITSNQYITNFIPLSGSDMSKFAILEYLYIIRVMISCIKKKNNIEEKSKGITFNINSPFKIITVPGKG